jgi:prepilin-type processing-associated H-X9-DG protein
MTPLSMTAISFGIAFIDGHVSMTKTGQSLTNANAAYVLADRVRTLWGEASDNLDIYRTLRCHEKMESV